ncbi:PTB domain-containing engulfment adapter protein 1 isoform X1 [Hemibagrus wyckioides]|uniref:PTB domain-containing engulfment adapter protein 1 isoform X1 n=1 Tax=Hemibagrus wyckioides TaxID=337641 RepID=UPI00266B439B|nr:PTB domain-containing engulfment adapter protein 1 isoform X1 [Hemibagrus wyckioides]XP_058248914.1 PTB domain-containing engulfment adapter protein 1 isoform X1 [Hemibagrus wyckioides]XP_058248915.1 PTB domain-containing engulfment adapter protein 1 isoform X1 [Hemibagrus wyckioides]XP_058248916.1 PTB domain-containing engulfment adapter protein 1 isoform X1 [Hemibagrus wyckioides]
MSRPFNRKKDKSWMHTPEALAKHFIAYNAKFLGNTEVDQPKGTEVVRDAVRKLKFQRHIKKSEGQKIPKVELQISIYGVKILDPKTKEVQHNCQLHRISFCADDKTDKRIFTFICKDSESNKHLCYVFDSEKCAEEITLTIGQAFDLAYKKFLESGGKDVETRKQIASLQKRIQELETENSELKKQLQTLEEQLLIAQVPPLLHINSTNEAYMLQRPSSLFWCHNLTSFSCLEISSVTLTPMSSPDSSVSAGVLTPPPSKPALPKPLTGAGLPRPRGGNNSSVPTDIFDMVPFSPVAPLVPLPASNSSPPPPPARPTEIRRDLFGAEPFDPFICGGADFPPDVQSRLDEMQEGFKMGLTVEGTVFSLDPLDGRC